MVIVDIMKRNMLNQYSEMFIYHSIIMSDEFNVYRGLDNSFKSHKVVEHGRKEYVRGNIHTNNIENFWSQLKRSIRGTHVFVSPQHLDKYVDEFAFRYNRRKDPSAMFTSLLSAVSLPSAKER